MKRCLVVMAVLVVLVMAAGCSFSFGKSVASTSWSSTSIESFTKELELDDKGEPFSEVALEVDVDLNGGTLAWEVFGPENNVLLSESTEGEYNETATLDPASGPWKLVVTATDVSGKLKLVLSGSK